MSEEQKRVPLAKFREAHPEDKHCASYYESVEDFQEAIAPDRPAKSPNSGSEGSGMGESWYGSKNYAHAVALLRDGWPEGREKMGKALEQSSAGIRQQIGNRLSFDLAGAYPIVPLYCAGVAEHMVHIGEDTRAQQPIIRFRISIAASAGVSADSIMARGAAILSWVDWLESNDQRCEIIVEEYSASGRNMYSCEVMFKRANAPLDIDRAAYCLINPGMLRRQFFRHIEVKAVSSEVADRVRQSGYGVPDDGPLPEDGAPEVYFGRMHNNEPQWKDPAKAAEFVRKQISNAGIRAVDKE